MKNDEIFPLTRAIAGVVVFFVLTAFGILFFLLGVICSTAHRRTMSQPARSEMVKLYFTINLSPNERQTCR